MRSVVFKQFGSPGEVLGSGDQPVPEPGPGQVRIKLIQSPIHNHDLAIIRGIYGYKPTLPAVPGTEAVGTIDKLGPDTTDLQLGQRVAVAGVAAAWAEFFLAKAAAAVPVPPGLNDDQACQLLAMPLSAYMALDDLGLKAGEWMIQNAANGAVGQMIDALAKERGVNVINLVRRAQSAEQLQAEGARHVLATDDAGWAAKVAQITAGAPVARAVDSIGGKAANDLMNVLGFGGWLMSFGAMSGEPMVIDVANVVFKQTTIKGFWATKRTEQTSGGETRRMITELVQLALAGRLPLRVAAKFPLAQAGQAAVASERPGRAGKIVLRAD